MVCSDDKDRKKAANMAEDLDYFEARFARRQGQEVATLG